MKIGNQLGLPEPLVEAVRNDPYDKGEADFSTTELIGPPRIAVLRQKWSKHLIEDASDRIFALLGKSVHTILEHSAGKRYIVEKRFIAEHDGYKIGGQIDLFDTKESILQDWKVTSQRSTGDAKGKYPWSSQRQAPEGKGWIEQGNINRLLMFKNGLNVKSIQYVAIYRDWSKMQAQRESQYPPRQVEVLTVPLWTIAETEAYLSKRIKLHVAARTELPMCTSEERWETLPIFAVTKAGAKRATRLFPTEGEAQERAAELTTKQAKYIVEPRPGESIRCLYYCSVASFCVFGREQLQNQAA